MAVTTLVAKDVNNSRLARCYVTIDGQKWLLMEGKSLEAKVEYDKQEIGILGKTAKGHKATSWNGSGNMTIYLVTSKFTELMKQFKDDLTEIYFTIQVINEDPTSDSGRQDVTLKQCSIDGGIIAAFDVDGDWLEQDIDFTFEDFTIAESFNVLDGMVSSNGNLG